MASLHVFRTGQQQCASGYERGEEIRDFYLIHYVIKGCGTYWLNNKAFHVHQGQCFLIYPHMTINYKADQNDPWEYCWVGFNGSDARLLMDAISFTPQMPIITVEQGERVHELLMNIYAKRGEAGYHAIAMTAALYQFLSFLMELTHKDYLRNTNGSDHVQQASDFVAMHYAEPITVEEIAKFVGLSRSHLYRLFREHINLSPYQYLTEFRIREACSLLKTKPLFVKEVAFAVGFDNPFNFSTVFKRYTGSTPKEYAQNKHIQTIDIIG